jgi:NADH-quinone oxidoreductase subunit I
MEVHAAAGHRESGGNGAGCEAHMMRYMAQIAMGCISLVKGLAITLKYFFRRPITVQYPDERVELPVRFRGRLVMPVAGENGENRCTSCMICAKACPNHSLYVEKTTDEAGKPKPAKYIYNLGTCMFCNLCVEACPFAAIIMSDDYELAVSDRDGLKAIDLLAEKYRLTGKKAEWWEGKL